jgi:hypothetical protein
VSRARVRPALALECHFCPWRPDPAKTMRTVTEHFEVEHPEATLVLDLAAVCTCGTTMKQVATRPTGGGYIDRFLCLSCGNEGTIKRGEPGDPSKSYKTPEEP